MAPDHHQGRSGAVRSTSVFWCDRSLTDPGRAPRNRTLWCVEVLLLALRKDVLGDLSTPAKHTSAVAAYRIWHPVPLAT